MNHVPSSQPTTVLRGGLLQAPPAPHYTRWALKTTMIPAKNLTNSPYHGFTDLGQSYRGLRRRDQEAESQGYGLWFPWCLSCSPLSVHRWAPLARHSARLPHGSWLSTVYSVQPCARTSKEQVIQFPLEVPPRSFQLWRLRLGPYRHIWGEGVELVLGEVM